DRSAPRLGSRFAVGTGHLCQIKFWLMHLIKDRGVSYVQASQDLNVHTSQLREDLHERGTKPIIPNRCNRKQPFSFSKRIYKLRWRIESAFNRLKDFRRIAARYDRLARNYLASVCLAAALVWWI